MNINVIISSSSDNKDNFYTLLGVEKDATTPQIKRAYRKMALKWHPDKNPDNKAEAEKMFLKISEAYEVLSNTKARQQYDTYGSAGGDSSSDSDGSGFGSWDDFFGRKKGEKRKSADDIFSQAFGGKDPFANMEEMFDILEEDEIIHDATEAAKADATKAAQVKSEKELENELMLFFKENRPEKATKKNVKKLVKKYGKSKKQKKKLYEKLYKKYDEKIGKKLKNILDPDSEGASGKDKKGGMWDFGDWDDFGSGNSGESGFSFSYSSSSTSMNADGTSSFSSTSYSSSGGKTVKKSIVNDGTETRAEETITEGGRTKRRKGRKMNDGSSKKARLPEKDKFEDL